VVTRTAEPATVASLARDLHALGVEHAMVLLVHSALSQLGWIAGGEQAVVLALLEAVGPAGTVVMPAHSAHLTEPAHWQNPPVPAAWWPLIRQHLPAFDPALTPTRGMGAIAECFRHLPGVRRSTHPTGSFTAHGPAAEAILAEHALGEAFGERSPLARIYALGGHVLLLGAGHASNTSLHLAEHRGRWPGKRWVPQGSPLLVDGERRWVAYEELDYDAADFGRLGAAFAAETGLERRGTVGAGEGRLMPQRELVDYAAHWIERHRT
jgi:aminoglycoside 3-N-acetyltransferase